MYSVNNEPMSFWGESNSTRQGRDPLAIQNSSVVVYSTMMPGITNVTAKIRYNAFYCWVLTVIAKKLGSIDPAMMNNLGLQIKYLRRSELLLAYMMTYSFNDVLSVSGTNYTSKYIKDEILHLAEGADLKSIDDNGGTKRALYWKNPRGIFGQYYVGVLVQLNLIYLPNSTHNAYRVTDLGLELYSAFRNSFANDEVEISKIEDEYWHAVHGGVIRKEALSRFNCMALHAINYETELDCYVKIFAQPETAITYRDATYYRINTMRLLLQHVKDGKGTVKKNGLTLSFLKSHFLSIVSQMDSGNVVGDEELSWFIYELNELSHAAFEAYHFALLYSIQDEPMPLDIYLGALKSKYEEYKSGEDVVDLNMSTYEIYDAMTACYKTHDYGKLMYFASLLIKKLYDMIQPHLKVMYDLAYKEGYLTHNGFAPALLSQLTYDGKCVIETWDFVENCLYQAINTHQRSSYMKSNIGQGLVHNYMIEEGLIWRLRKPNPIRTSPRLDNVIQYMEDAHWITYDNNTHCYVVAERGEKILKS